jgi:hypothetical protein
MIPIAFANKLPIYSKKPAFQGGWGIQIYNRAQKIFSGIRRSIFCCFGENLDRVE